MLRLVVGNIKKALRIYEKKGVGDILNVAAKASVNSIEDILKEVMEEHDTCRGSLTKRAPQKFRNFQLYRVLNYVCCEERLDVGFLVRMVVEYTRSQLMRVFKFVVEVYNRDSLRALREKRMWTRQIALSSVLSGSADATTEYGKAAVDKVYQLLLQHNKSIAQDITVYRDAYRLQHPQG